MLDSGRVDLQGLNRLTKALARYRQHIGGRYDVRVLSFDIHLAFKRGMDVCRLSLEGTPPDGSLLSPCVMVNKEEVCGTPVDDWIQFDESQLEQLQKCFSINDGSASEKWRGEGDCEASQSP